MSTQGGAERLRFEDCVVEQTGGGHCRARVVLSWGDGPRHTGEAEGLGSAAGEMRTAAQACVNALIQGFQGQAAMELLGVKALRAFDATLIIVSIMVQIGERTQRMVGSILVEGESARGAALAVLNATNRVLGNRVLLR